MQRRRWFYLLGCGISLLSLVLLAAGCSQHLSGAAAPPAAVVAGQPPAQTAPSFQPYTLLPQAAPKPTVVTHTHQALHLIVHDNRRYLEDRNGKAYQIGRDSKGYLCPVYQDPATGAKYPLYYDHVRDRLYRVARAEDGRFYRGYVGDPGDRFYASDRNYDQDTLSDQDCPEIYDGNTLLQGDSDPGRDDYYHHYHDHDDSYHQNYPYGHDGQPAVSAVSSGGHHNNSSWLWAIPVIIGAYLLLQPHHHSGSSPQYAYPPRQSPPTVIVRRLPIGPGMVINNRNTVINNQSSVINNRNTVINNRNTVINNRNTVINNRNTVINNRNTVTGVYHAPYPPYLQRRPIAVRRVAGSAVVVRAAAAVSPRPIRLLPAVPRPRHRSVAFVHPLVHAAAVLPPSRGVRRPAPPLPAKARRAHSPTQVHSPILRLRVFHPATQVVSARPSVSKRTETRRVLAPSIAAQSIAAPSRVQHPRPLMRTETAFARRTAAHTPTVQPRLAPRAVPHPVTPPRPQPQRAPSVDQVVHQAPQKPALSRLAPQQPNQRRPNHSDIEQPGRK